MPRKVRIPADPAQNRENQQRSRARRKAYLESLEERIRTFEARDARATLEMQRAAREVAWVNERLLELLAEKGVRREEVDGFLRRCRREEGDEEGGEGGGGRGERRECGSNATPGAGAVHVGSGTSLESQIDTNDSTPAKLTNETQGKETTVSQPCGAETNTNTDTEDSSCALRTSCEAAASIIAGFQGHGDVSRARTALGCGEVDAAKCHVKNTRLFQLMDEA
ncbi:hypothetical protein F5Y08DRAFT_303611 [Xylaria arbuscula]|nr:hypothetical protein F5Y08DRAFT_303611 [Xylaria arbuscula]